MTNNMLSIGTLLGDGRYRIEQHLSSGGFGNTYIATNLIFNDKVAVKEFFMRGMTQRDENGTVSVSNPDNQKLFQEQLEKFKKEAMRLRRLNNPHIVRVHDLLEANGTIYYVMDYIEGESLAARMQRTGQPLSEAEAMNYFSQILDALEAVHAEGLCHSDLKPANIMVDKNGNAVLIDFGASKQVAGDNGATMTSVAFTNGYAPIEQIEQDVAHFGPWTDIYALGATLYALLTQGKPPMPSTIFTDTTPYKQNSLPLPANVSPATKQLILKMMTMNWTERPQSISALRALMAQPAPMGEESTVLTSPTPTNEENTVLTPQTPQAQQTPQPVSSPEETNMGTIEPQQRHELYEKGGGGSNNKGLILAIIGAVIALLCAWLLISKCQSENTDEQFVYPDTTTVEDNYAEEAAVPAVSSPTYQENAEEGEEQLAPQQDASASEPAIRVGYHRGYLVDPVDDYVNVREGPGKNYDIAMQLDTGTDILFTTNESHWYKVYDTNYNYLGYIFHDRIVEY